MIAEEVARGTATPSPTIRFQPSLPLDVGGKYQWRREGEHHVLNPMAIAKLQQATRENSAAKYEEYAGLINDQSRKLGTLRGLLRVQGPRPIRSRSKKWSPGPRS